MGTMLEFQKPIGKPLLRGNDHYWLVILDLDAKGEWTVHEVWMQSRAKARGTVQSFVARLVKGAIAVPTGNTKLFRNLPTPAYRLAKRPTATPSLKADGTPSHLGRGQLQMWNVLRSPMGRDGVSVVDLALFASTDAVPVAQPTARRYAERLAAAGYLLEGRAKPTIYKLKPAMNTGPKPPAIVEARMVYDRNRGAIVGSVEARESAS